MEFSDVYSPSKAPFHRSDDIFHAPNETDILEDTRRLEAYLKGQGYLTNESLNILNPTPYEASRSIQLFFQLAQQQQNDRGAREQLRDQADKDRVAAALAQKKNESLEEGNRRLGAQVKDLESKLLAAKHTADEQVRELKTKLQSTTSRLNTYLYGGRDATGKRAAGGSGAAGAAGSVGPGGARRVAAPAYDRFRDDPAEAAATVLKLDADMAQLRQTNMRLKKELAAAREQAGRRDDQAAAAERGGGAVGSDDEQQRRSSGSQAAGRSPISPDADTARLQRNARELQLTVDHIRRQLDKATEERSALHTTLHSLRQKNASLDQERRNAEDRFLRAQRASAALQEPAAAEAHATELRAKLVASQLELREANVRLDALQQRLPAVESESECNRKHVEVLKRALKVMPHGANGLELLAGLVAEEMRPVHEQLGKARAELEQARAQASAALRAPGPPATSAGAVASPSDRVLPLSPAGAQPFSPGARFDGFAPGPLPSSGSPPLLQPPPVHAFYNRAFSATMPCATSDRMLPSCPEQQPSQHEQDHQPQAAGGEGFGSGGGGGWPPSSSSSLQPPIGGRINSSPLLQFQAATAHGGFDFGAGSHHSTTTMDIGGYTSEVGTLAAAGGGGTPHWRRSLSAGPSRANMSAERQRRTWQVLSNPHAKRFPSPIDILMEQAHNPMSADGTISILHGSGQAGGMEKQQPAVSRAAVPGGVSARSPA